MLHVCMIFYAKLWTSLGNIDCSCTNKICLQGNRTLPNKFRGFVVSYMFPRCSILFFLLLIVRMNKLTLIFHLHFNSTLASPVEYQYYVHLYIPTHILVIFVFTVHKTIDFKRNLLCRHQYMIMSPPPSPTPLV